MNLPPSSIGNGNILMIPMKNEIIHNQRRNIDTWGGKFIYTIIENKASGEASTNSLVNLAQSGVITLDWVENYVKKKIQEN